MYLSISLIEAIMVLYLFIFDPEISGLSFSRSLADLVLLIWLSLSLRGFLSGVIFDGILAASRSRVRSFGLIAEAGLFFVDLEIIL